MTTNDSLTIVRVQFGSHLYGTTTPQSDIDYKSVHVPGAGQLGRVGPGSRRHLLLDGEQETMTDKKIGWISVDDGLPFGEDHLLYVDDGSINPPYYLVGYWNRLTDCWMVRCMRNPSLPVTHWRPLPESPASKVSVQ